MLNFGNTILSDHRERSVVKLHACNINASRRDATIRQGGASTRRWQARLHATPHGTTFRVGLLR
jgi:hypothetical protein